MRSLPVLAVLGAVLPSAAHAGNLRTWSLEQAPIAFPLVTGAEDARVFQRITLPALTETLELAPGRALRLLPNHDVPALIERGGASGSIRVTLAAVEAVVDPTGRAELQRRVVLTGPAGEALGEMTLALEIDLSGLAAEQPELAIRNAQVVAGSWAGSKLLNRPVWARPQAPLVWRAPSAALAIALEGGTLRGSLRLPRGLTPEAFGGAARLDGAKARHLVIEWTEDGAGWSGTLSAEVEGPLLARRMSVRLGDASTPLSVQAVAALD